MKTKVKRNIALLCAVCLLYALICGYTLPGAAGADAVPSGSLETTAVYVDGILTASSCYLIEDTSYMPPAALFAALQLSFETTEDGWILTGDAGAVTVRLSGDGQYLEANGRCLYLGAGPLDIDGVACLPVEPLAKVMGDVVRRDEGTGGVDIDTTHTAVLESGDSFYDAEDLKWLSRIISAESENQSLAGMIGVGNVVLNRVANASFPDTVQEVVFDTRYGIQFSPVETGAIYDEPSEQAVIAAKLCLDGASVAGDSLYFVNPETGSTAWFRETRTFVVTIEDHDFYA